MQEVIDQKEFPKMEIGIPAEWIKQALKEEIERQRVSMTEVNWTTRQAAERMNLKPERIRAICANPKFRKELDADNGGPVLIPYQGGGYQIEPQRFVKFCHQHWKQIMELKTR